MKNFCDNVSFVYFLHSHIEWYYFSFAGYSVFESKAVTKSRI